MNIALSKIKDVSSDTVIPILDESEEELQDLFMLISNGRSKRVYGVFYKRVINLGKVDGNVGRKSWEDPNSTQYRYYLNISQRHKNL